VKIKHVAAATLTPAAIAGIAVPLAILTGPAQSSHTGHSRHPARAQHAAHAHGKAAHSPAHAAADAHTAPHSAAHSAAHSTAQHAKAPASTAQHLTTQHSATQQGTTQQGTTQHAATRPVTSARVGHIRDARPTDQQAPAPQPPVQQAPADSLASVTVYGSPFEKCVAWRESTDTPTDPDGLFGILPSTWASLGYSGTAGQAPISVQVAAFNQLYAEDGAQPWAPSDGC
jgi:hypothetical protein